MNISLKYILTAIKNAKATFLLITSVFSNIFRQNKFYSEDKSFLNKLTTFCMKLVDNLIFKFWKAIPWSKSKSRRIFHNVKRRLKGNLIPIPKVFFLSKMCKLNALYKKSYWHWHWSQPWPLQWPYIDLWLMVMKQRRSSLSDVVWSLTWRTRSYCIITLILLLLVILTLICKGHWYDLDLEQGPCFQLSLKS